VTVQPVPEEASAAKGVGGGGWWLVCVPAELAPSHEEHFAMVRGRWPHSIPLSESRVLSYYMVGCMEGCTCMIDRGYLPPAPGAGGVSGPHQCHGQV
jgi:hypothetical protein